jgi:PAS domain S-box-containing protein
VSARELVELRARLAGAEETLRAIRSGEVDALVVEGKEGSQVFTLQGAEHEYRVLIESMNEGALTITTGRIVLYANQSFARMANCPLEQVTGSSLRRFLSAGDAAMLRRLMKRVPRAGVKCQALLHARDGSQMPVQISIRALARNGINRAAIGMVVTDMTAARRNEQLLRALTHRVVQVQESERERVALELHDRVSQLLCAVLIRGQVLADRIPSRDRRSKREAMRLRALLAHTAEEVERISRALRSSALADLGLDAVLRETSSEFAERTGVSVSVACVRLTARLPAHTELALYRLLQDALRNVEQHARASRVTVCLKQQGDFVRLVIIDNGIGFDPLLRAAGQKQMRGGLGLLGMRERVAHVGGSLKVKSARGTGTEIDVRIPLHPAGSECLARTGAVTTDTCSVVVQ